MKQKSDEGGWMLIAALCLVVMLMGAISGSQPKCERGEVPILGVNFKWSCARAAR